MSQSHLSNLRFCFCKITYMLSSWVWLNQCVDVEYNSGENIGMVKLQGQIYFCKTKGILSPPPHIWEHEKIVWFVVTNKWYVLLLSFYTAAAVSLTRSVCLSYSLQHKQSVSQSVNPSISLVLNWFVVTNKWFVLLLSF